MKDAEFTDSQKAIVGLASYAEDIVAKLSFGLFVPEWSLAILRRLRRNNTLAHQRKHKE